MNREKKAMLNAARKAAISITVAFLLALAFAALSSPSLHGQAKGGWITLLDGKSLANWTPQGDANWSLMDGAVVADKGMGYLVSKDSYTDFQVRAEFWVSDDANSGVFLRCSEPQNVTISNCYEVNIFDSRPDRTGAITNIAKPSVSLKTGGKWNTYEITAQGPHLVVILNGTKTVDIENSKFQSGPHRDSSLCRPGQIPQA